MLTEISRLLNTAFFGQFQVLSLYALEVEAQLQPSEKMAIHWKADQKGPYNLNFFCSE